MNVAQKLNISLEEFKDPLNTKKNNYKSLNNKFFYLIFLSDKFKHDFYEILEKELLNIYTQTYTSKFVKLFKKFEYSNEKSKNK